MIDKKIVKLRDIRNLRLKDGEEIEDYLILLPKGKKITIHEYVNFFNKNFPIDILKREQKKEEN